MHEDSAILLPRTLKEGDNHENRRKAKNEAKTRPVLQLLEDGADRKEVSHMSKNPKLTEKEVSERAASIIELLKATTSNPVTIQSITEGETTLMNVIRDVITQLEGDPLSDNHDEYEARNVFDKKLDSLISGWGEALGLNWIYEHEFVDQDRTKIQSIIIKFLGSTAEADTAEPSSEVISAKKRIVEAVEAAAADAANADNCIADYHFSMETAAENGKDITKFSIVFEN